MYSIALGGGATANNLTSMALGYNSEASGQNSAAVGYNATASGLGATALGYNSTASNSYSIAIGNGADSSSADTIAIGYASTANNTYSTSLGYNSEASGAGSAALGPNAKASGSYSVAIGGNSNYLGDSAVASGTNSIAIGNGAKAANNYNIAIGTNACQGVTGTNVTCLGSNSGPASKYSHLSGDSNMVYIGDPNSTVFIPGNLAVRGTVLLNGERGRVVLRPGNAQGDWAVIRKGDYDGGDDNLRGYPTDVNEDKAWYDRYSDSRLKYVGKENTSGLEKIKQLKVFNYTFKKDENKTPHVGVIAQDLQKVFPDAVTKAKDGFLRIRFEDMFYAMINAIKELDSRITALEKENQELTEILKQVQNDNRKLQDDNKEFETRLKILEAKIK